MPDSRRRLWFTGLLTLVLTAVPATAAPGLDEVESLEERCGGGSHSASVHGRDGRYDIKIKQGRCRLEIEMRGDVEFLGDESGVARMSRRARLDITEKIGGRERRLVVTPGDGGDPVHSWSVDGRDAAFDDDARVWLRQTLPELFRSTGIDAPGRVGRLLARGGVDAALAEVRLVSGDHSQRRYLEEIVRQAEMDAADLEEALEIAGRELSSDFELTELLIGVAGDLDLESLQAAYAEATDSIGSDFELRRALTPLVERRDLGEEALGLALETARSIGSDFELAELLIAVSRKHPAGQPLPRGFTRAIGEISSDFEHRRVLDAFLKRDSLDRETLDAVLATAEDIGSDFENAELLIEVARVYPPEEPLPRSFFAALDTVGSDFENRRVLDAALGRETLDRDTAVALLAASHDVDSDFEMAEFLIAFAGAYPIDDEIRPSFSRALDTVGSKHERGRVLAAAGDR